jgi:hypothetical protein
MPPAGVLPPLFEVPHSFLHDRKIVRVKPLPVRVSRREFGLDSRRKAFTVRFHTKTTVREIDPFELRLPGASPPGREG